MSGGSGGTPATAPGAIAVVPATPDRWPDLEDLLPRGGGWPCWCQAWRRTAADFATTDRVSRRDALRAALEVAPPPGLIAYDGAAAVGWCGLGPRSGFPRVDEVEGLADEAGGGEWSIVCFALRPDHRTAEVVRALVEAAIAEAEADEATSIETYAVDAGEDADATAWYAGLAGILEAAGFERIRALPSIEPAGPRVLLRRELAADG